MDVKFGYFNCSDTLQTSNFRIYPDSENTYSEIKENADKDGWLFAPYKETRLFSLPFNYHLNGTFSSDQHAKFIIWCLSFFYGTKLATHNPEFIDATCINLHQLGYLYVKQSDIEVSLEIIYEQFCQNTEDDNARIMSIIHLLFLCENRRLFQFERFTYLYMALDSCYAVLLNKKRVSKCLHSERMLGISNALGIPYDTYFDNIPSIRNDLFHEGIVNNRPIGYAHLDTNLLFLSNFICKSVFSILGINCKEYIEQAKSVSRDIFGIRII